MSAPMPARDADAPDPARAHARLIKSGSLDRALHNHLISLYARSPSTLSSALLLLRRLPFPPSPISWTSLLSSPHLQPNLLLSLFRSLLHSSSSCLSHGPLSAVLKSLPSAALLPFHALALKLALARHPFSGSALVRLYSKSSRPADAFKAFDDIPLKDEVCYAAAIVGLAQNRRPSDALLAFKTMHSDSVPTTMYAVSGALRAAAELAALEQTRVLHAHAVVAGVEPNFVVTTALVDGYGKSGLVSDARKVFDGFLMEANLVAWNAMLAAYAQQGNVETTITLFQEMMERGFAPDELTFLAILTACSNTGKVGEAEHWIALMRSHYEVQPGIEHYTCLVGAMARAGRLEDAEQLVMTMPFKPDVPVWRALLSGCVAHGAVDMARAAGCRLLELDPRDDSAYIMLANVYSATGKKDEKAEAWTTMRDWGVKKEGGRSWVEVRGEVHVFVSEDRKHKRSDEIYAKLMELIHEVRKLGYTGSKEGLWYHSEKLAVAFGVVCRAAPEGKALRVVKNLRICGDCHEFFKHVSKVLEREIVVRDVNRYHRFEHGGCTCNDYW